jgi:hypothetical protein
MKRKARAAATADGGKGSDRQDEQRIGARIEENTRALLQLNEEVRTAMARTTPPTDAEFALFVKKVNARQEEFERLSRQLEEVRTRNMPREGQSEEQRNIEFERIKADMVRLNQMQQALSNTLNSLDEKSKNAIQRIKGG